MESKEKFHPNLKSSLWERHAIGACKALFFPLAGTLTRTSRKSKISNNKFQINHRLQITMNKTTAAIKRPVSCLRFRELGIGFYLLFGFCNL